MRRVKVPGGERAGRAGARPAAVVRRPRRARGRPSRSLHRRPVARAAARPRRRRAADLRHLRPAGREAARARRLRPRLHVQRRRLARPHAHGGGARRPGRRDHELPRADRQASRRDGLRALTRVPGQARRRGPRGRRPASAARLRWVRPAPAARCLDGRQRDRAGRGDAGQDRRRAPDLRLLDRRRGRLQPHRDLQRSPRGRGGGGRGRHRDRRRAGRSSASRRRSPSARCSTARPTSRPRA